MARVKVTARQRKREIDIACRMNDLRMLLWKRAHAVRTETQRRSISAQIRWEADRLVKAGVPEQAIQALRELVGVERCFLCGRPK